MKKTTLILFALFFSAIASFAQHTETKSEDLKTLPSVKVKDLKGQTIDTKTFNNDGKPFVISFWATWCNPCIKELTAIHNIYKEWQEKTGVKVIAISIDDTRSTKKVAPFVNGKGWEFEFYCDPNNDFKRAMNVTDPPFTFLVNGKGEIVFVHQSYAPGDEDFLLKEIQKLTDKKETK